MTTIVTALDRIARGCSVENPSSWIAATKDAEVEIRDDFLLATIEDIQDRIDLPSPIGKLTTLTGGAGTTDADDAETFTLPSDFKRIAKDDLAVYDVFLDRAVNPVKADGMYNFLVDQGASGVIKWYILEGYDENYTIKIWPAPGTGQTIQLQYISKNWMATSGGTEGDMLTADTDVLLLPRTVVESGTIWRYRERRGLPYVDRYNQYEAQLARLANEARPVRKINMGEPDRRVRWQDMVPAYIPDS